MKTIFLLLMMSLTVLSGCAESATLIRAGSNSIRSDIFQEFSSGGLVPQGYAELRVVSSLKTHKPGIYPFEKKNHGTPEYRMLVNIDGQAVQLQGDMQKEHIGPSGHRAPEAGDGIRYRFSKTLRLKGGTHRITVALPGDQLAIEREVTLSDGSRNTLVLEPTYGASPDKQRPGFYGVTSFRQGVKGLRPTLNGKEI